MFQLPNSAPLLAFMPPPRFPERTADDWFTPAEVPAGASVLESFAAAFGYLQELGYRSIGVAQDREDQIQVAGHSSGAATIWVVWYLESLAVLVTGLAESRADHFIQHLNRCIAESAPVVEYGSFPIRVAQIESCAAEFRRALGARLAGGRPDLVALQGASREALQELSHRVWRRSARRDLGEALMRGRHWRAARLFAYLEPHLSPAEVAAFERVKLQAATLPPPLERGLMSEAEWMEARAQLVRAANARLRNAAELRDTSSQARMAWEDAADEFQRALELMYGSELEGRLDALKAGSPDAVEWAITTLEVDPSCFRSGYMKERVMRRIRRAPLSGPQATRLRSVLLARVDGGDRREFGGYCRLARRLDSEALRAELLGRLDRSADAGVRRRALWMYSTLRDSALPGRPAALSVLVEGARDEQWYRVSGWVGRLARKHADAGFVEMLLQQASGSEEAASRPALRLLSRLSRLQLSDQDRRTLQPAILRCVRREWDVPEVVEALSAMADSSELRRRLAELEEHPDSDVQRLAHWSLNAMRRRNG